MSDDLDPTPPQSERGTPSRIRLLGQHFLHLSRYPAALLERRASLNLVDEPSSDPADGLRESPIAARLLAGNSRSSNFIPEATNFKGGSRSKRETDATRQGRITYVEENVHVTPNNSTPTLTPHDGASCGAETTCSNATQNDRRSKSHKLSSPFTAVSDTAASAVSDTVASVNEASNLFPKADKKSRALDQQTDSSGDGVEVHIPSRMLDTRGSVFLKIRLARKSLSHPASHVYTVFCGVLSIFCYAACVVLIMLIPITKMAVGFIYFNGSNDAPSTPTFLLVSGALGFIRDFWGLVMKLMYADYQHFLYENRVSSLLISINVIEIFLFFYGCAMVFQCQEVHECHPVPYWFAMWVIVVTIFFFTFTVLFTLVYRGVDASLSRIKMAIKARQILEDRVIEIFPQPVIEPQQSK
ncbi:uncharacterized protein LOC131952586 [Physella acuta]|uniref:uncharacterized protein LOC131952586 n=1 Tax=Physella acuta TaxID=109671 RepID=UPI0027DC8814|nr:uncharacterized protein LOC131952586 [Physella acuta]